MFKTVFVLLSVFFSFSVLCQTDPLVADLGDELPEFFDLDEVETVPRAEVRTKRVRKEVLERECFCQCLTGGKKPKRDVYFRGVWNGDRCLCSCASKK